MDRLITEYPFEDIQKAVEDMTAVRRSSRC